MSPHPPLDPIIIRRKQFITLALKRAKPGSGSGIDFLTKRTWTFFVSNLRNIIQQKPFVIAGDVATRLYMPERMTLYLDILVLKKDAPIIYQQLTQAGSLKIRDLAIEGSQWTLPDRTSLDVLESDEPWAIIALQSPNYSPDGLPIIALPYLVLMKRKSSRTQDLADISRMMFSASQIDIENVKNIIKQYLPEALEDLESLIILGKLEGS